jgi:hypothetical protein
MMDCLAYSPDLSRCDFFLFGHLNLAAQSFDSDAELFAGVQAVAARMSGELLISIFVEGMGRFWTCYHIGTECIE